MPTVNRTIIRATARPEDLIPAFLTELFKVDPKQAARILNEVFADLPESYLRSEPAVLILHDLVDLLDANAPSGYYFGVTEGDSSDYGFWELPE